MPNANQRVCECSECENPKQDGECLTNLMRDRDKLKEIFLKTLDKKQRAMFDALYKAEEKFSLAMVK